MAVLKYMASDGTLKPLKSIKIKTYYKNPVLKFRDLMYVADRENGKVTFYTTIDIRNTEYPINEEWGILFTWYSELEDIQYGDENVYPTVDRSIVAKSSFADSDIYLEGFYDEDFENHTQFAVRMYAKVKKSNGDSTIIYGTQETITL